MHSLAFLPSPPSNALHIGPLQLRAYGFMIAIGVLAAIWMCRVRWRKRGGDPDDIIRIAYWAIPGGLIGARLYHVITDFNRLYTHDLIGTIEVWKGGLGIPGGVIGGVAAGLYAAHRMRLPFGPLFDMVAPALPLAQAIGRLGNWFNQELYGRPSTLPWALEINAAHRSLDPIVVNRYPSATTFSPTFAYEALWNLGLMALLLALDRFRGRLPGWLLGCFYVFFSVGVGMDLWLVAQRQQPRSASAQVALFVVGTIIGAVIVWLVIRMDTRGPLHWGDLFALYVAGYSLGRMWVESLRIDKANTPGGLRVNEWTSIAGVVLAFGFLLWHRTRGGELATASNVPIAAARPARPAKPGSDETTEAAPPDSTSPPKVAAAPGGAEQSDDARPDDVPAADDA